MSFLFFLLAFTAILSGETFGAERTDEMKMSPWTGKYSLLVVAHRGFSGAAPENTLAAFRKAMEVGCDVIELDVQLSADGKVIVLHDDKLERTTNGRGLAADHPLREIRSLDAGSWYGPEFAGEKIPTLTEVLNAARNRVLVNVEIKHPEHGKYPISELTEKAWQEVSRARMADRVVFSSFNPNALFWLKKNAPASRRAFLYHRPWESVSDIPDEKEYSVLNLRNIHLTRIKIRKIHGEGKKINVYTVNSDKEMEQFVRWGADGIITNHPDRLIRILKEDTDRRSPLKTDR